MWRGEAFLAASSHLRQQRGLSSESLKEVDEGKVAIGPGMGPRVT